MLTEAAQSLLLRRLSGEHVGVTEANRPIYRELVAAGLMEPIATFVSGPEGHFRLTEKAVIARAIPAPAPSIAPTPRG